MSPLKAEALAKHFEEQIRLERLFQLRSMSAVFGQNNELIQALERDLTTPPPNQT